MAFAIRTRITVTLPLKGKNPREIAERMSELDLAVGEPGTEQATAAAPVAVDNSLGAAHPDMPEIPEGMRR